MKVKAIAQGYMGKIIEPGTEFELKDIEYKDADGSKKVHKAEDQFSDSWMAKVAGGKKSSKKDLEQDEPESDESDSDGSVI